jgi:hypothetical protein
MSNQIQAVEENMVPPSPHVSDPNREKRDKTIRIRSYNYNRLAKLGDLSQDFDYALTKVLDFYEKHQQQQQKIKPKEKNSQS